MAKFQGTYEVEKQEAEVFFIDVDFAEHIASGEAIVIGNCSALMIRKSDDQDMSTTMISSGTLATMDTTKLKVQIKGGSLDDKEYILSIRCGTDVDNVFEEDILITMRS